MDYSIHWTVSAYIVLINVVSFQILDEHADWQGASSYQMVKLPKFTCKVSEN